MTHARRLAWRLWEPLSDRAGRGYIAGPDPADALRLCRGLDVRGMGSTIGYWNAPSAEPLDVAAAWREGVAMLDPALDCHVALKAPALGYDAARMEEIARVAAAGGATIHLDAHWAESADATLALAVRLRLHVPVRVALPARWRRSIEDAELAIEHGLEVRLVKGEWPDPSAPDLDPSAGYLTLARILAGRTTRVGVATHDVALAHEALHALRAAGTDAELELLFGLPVTRHATPARRLGVPVRVYVPFGHPFSPYTLSTVRRDRRAAWWMARDLAGLHPARWMLESAARRAEREGGGGAGRAAGAAGAHSSYRSMR